MLAAVKRKPLYAQAPPPIGPGPLPPMGIAVNASVNAWNQQCSDLVQRGYTLYVKWGTSGPRQSQHMAKLQPQAVVYHWQPLSGNSIARTHPDWPGTRVLEEIRNQAKSGGSLFSAMDNYVVPIVTTAVLAAVGGEMLSTFTAAPAATTAAESTTNYASGITTTSNLGTNYLADGTINLANSSTIVSTTTTNLMADGTVNLANSSLTTMAGATPGLIDSAIISATGPLITDATLNEQVLNYSNAAYANVASSGISADSLGQNMLKQAEKKLAAALLPKVAGGGQQPSNPPPAATGQAAAQPPSDPPLNPLVLMAGAFFVKLAFFS